VLFFKQGKFYEAFHMDADVLVRELGMIYMKVRACGCLFVCFLVCVYECVGGYVSWA